MPRSSIARKSIRFAAIFIPLLVTALLWIGAKVSYGQNLELSNYPVYLSQILSLLGFVMIAITFFIATRTHSVEKFYGGLDKVYSTHNILARIAFIFILAHPLLLAVRAFPDWNMVTALFVPFTQNSNLAMSMGVIGLYGIAVLILISIVSVLPYNVWKFLHSFMGVFFIIVGYHAFTAFSDVRFYPPLTLWVAIWLAIGAGSWVFKTFLYRHFGPRYEYRITSTRDLGEGLRELHLEPVYERISFEPGEFVYISFRDNPRIPREHHPFGISSSLDKEDMRISYREVGDFTSLMKNARQGDNIDIYGPFGEFTSFMFASHKKQIWLAGGIGIAPYLSMLHYEAHNEDKKDIYFYYANKSAPHSVYIDEIQETAKNADDRIRIIEHLDDRDGFITAAEVMEDVHGKLKDYLILMCGPPVMMHNLRDQFLELGVKPEMIVFEEFDFV